MLHVLCMCFCLPARCAETVTCKGGCYDEKRAAWWRRNEVNSRAAAPR